MSNPPDLQAFVRKRGGYDKITAEAWAEWDARVSRYQEARFAQLETDLQYSRSLRTKPQAQIAKLETEE